MLLGYQFDNREYKFTLEDDRVYGQNVFTIIVGKNGTGKSRLLSGLVNDVLGRRARDMVFSQEIVEISGQIISDRIAYESLPEKVIATSTSPFDKFPLPRRLSKHQAYSYLGLRDLRTHNFGLSYLSKIMLELVSSVAWHPEQMQDIGHVLNYLGYSESILIRMEMRVGELLLETLYHNDNFEENIQKLLKSNSFLGNWLDKRFFLEEDGSLSLAKVYRLKNIISSYPLFQRRMKFDITMHQKGINIEPEFTESIDDFLFLFEAGITSVRGVELQNNLTKKVFSISSASSGEQCVILGVLGIASQICNNALICIDEPEICLHPEWQEKYIRILISTFRSYKNCHFVIATHSPQIISNLESTNCYILNMEDRKVINANTVNHNSIDFQLANVFKAPGFKNEFLSRIALNTFAKVSKHKQFDQEDLDYLQLLEEVSKYFDDDDPIGSLVSTLQQLKGMYA